MYIENEDILDIMLGQQDILLINFLLPKTPLHSRYLPFSPSFTHDIIAGIYSQTETYVDEFSQL
jgi:hypothetical protein